jgi:hypothetical protein
MRLAIGWARDGRPCSFATSARPRNRQCPASPKYQATPAAHPAHACNARNLLQRSSPATTLAVPGLQPATTRPGPGPPLPRPRAEAKAAAATRPKARSHGPHRPHRSHRPHTRHPRHSRHPGHAAESQAAGAEQPPARPAQRPTANGGEAVIVCRAAAYREGWADARGEAQAGLQAAPMPRAVPCERCCRGRGPSARIQRCSAPTSPDGARRH